MIIAVIASMGRTIRVAVALDVALLAFFINVFFVFWSRVIMPLDVAAAVAVRMTVVQMRISRTGAIAMSMSMLLASTFLNIAATALFVLRTRRLTTV